MNFIKIIVDKNTYPFQLRGNVKDAITGHRHRRRWYLSLFYSKTFRIIGIRIYSRHERSETIILRRKQKTLNLQEK